MKERYEDSSIVEELIYPENVLLGLLEKKGETGMVGSRLPVPIIYGNPQGLSAGFSTAQTNATNVKTEKWEIEAGDYYGVVHIGDKVLQASRTNAGAFLDNKKVEIDALWTQAGENLSLYAWGNGGQALGRRASASGNVVTLANPTDVANFEVGMIVRASAADGSAAADTLRTGVDAITAVNRAAGTITFDNVADISGFIDLDYLFREGDFFGDQGVVVMKGVQSFISGSDAPPTLWGISNTTRATDLQRFAGCRVPDNALVGLSIDARIKRLCSYMAGRFKAKMPTAGFLHPEDFDSLETLMAARGTRPLEDDNTKFGFMKIDIATGSGRIPIYCDRHTPKGTFFALRLEDWWVSSMGELLRAQDGDGLEVLRRASSTDYEYRLISYPLLANRAPKNSGRVSLT